MLNAIPKAFFAYASSGQTLKEAIQDAVPILNKNRQADITFKRTAIQDAVPIGCIETQSFQQ